MSENNNLSTLQEFASRGARLALSGALAASMTPVCAFGSETDADSSNVGSVAEQLSDAIDITSEWNAGATVISHGGRYVLTGDVSTDGALVVNVPEGESATLDLAGHSVEVRGSACAAIIADNSRGHLSIIDSSFDAACAAGQKDSSDEATSAIRLVASNVTDSVTAIRLNVAVDESNAAKQAEKPSLTLSHIRVQSALASASEDIDTDKKLSSFGVYVGLSGSDDALDISLNGCTIEAAVSSDDAPDWSKIQDQSVSSEHAGIAASVATQAKGITLESVNKFFAYSPAGEANLYATVDDAFSLAAEATFDSEISIYANGNKDAAKLLAAAGEDQAREIASRVIDAIDKRAGVASGSDVIVAAAEHHGSSDVDATANMPAAIHSTPSASAAVKRTSASLGSLAQPKEHKASPLLSSRIDGSPLTQPEAISYLVDQSVDLSKAWVDTSQPFVISESGTYYLDADLTLTKGNLKISGSGIDVRLVLNGHTLNFDLTSGYMAGINISGSADVAISGGDAAGSITYSSAAPGNVISWGSSGTLSLDNVNVVSRKTENYLAQSTLSMHALGISAGNVEIDHCSFTVDQSNLTTASSTAKTDPYPAVIYDGRIGASSSTVSLKKSSLKLIASANATLETSGTKVGVSGFGVYATSKALYSLEGCNIDVSAANGDAVGIYASQVTVGSGTADQRLSINVNGATSAFGIKAKTAGGVLLDGQLAVTFSGDAAPATSAALTSDRADSFKIGKGFAGSDLGVLIGSDSATYNGADVRIAAFDYTPTEDQAAAAAAALRNALGDQASCTVEAADDGLYFRLSDSNASLEVESSNGTNRRFANLSQAFAACADGDTVRLLADIDSVAYQGAAQKGQNINLDLNGHSISSLSSTSTLASLTVLDGAGCASIRHIGSGAAVSVQGSSDVFLSNIAVEAVSYNASAYGIQLGNSASIHLSNVAVRGETTNGTAAGIYAPAGSSGSITADGGSITAAVSTATATAYGIQVIPASISTTLSDCAIKATTASTSAYGVVTSGPLDACGANASSQLIEASCDQASATATALRASGATEQPVQLRNCSLKTSCAAKGGSVGDFWCIDTSLAANAKLTLDGAMSFSSASATAIKHAAPFALGKDFFLAGDDRITLESSQLADDAFAELADGADKQACMQAFEALSTSVYDGCSIKIADGKLAWSRMPVARIASTGAEFTSISAALAQASDGDTITLTDDARDVSSVAISKDVTIDLAGHAWYVDAAAKASSGAIAVSGSACLAIHDSLESGRLLVSVGSPNELSSTKVTYSALVNNSTGTMTLDGIDAQVIYTGAATTAREVRTVGIMAGSGKVELSNASKLSVRARENDDDYACSEVVGVLVNGSTKREAFVQDASSSIEVINDAQAQIDGSQYINSSTLNNLNPILKQITPDENSDLYKEILEKFRLSASLDTSATSESYGARVYRVNAMQLDDGTMVWAYSDYVAPGEETLDNIKPKAIFVRSTYALEPQATGISSEVVTNVDGTIATAGGASVRGSVSAQAAHGEATAVSVRGSGQWLLDGASLSAFGSSGTFMKRDTENNLDLGDFIEAPNKPENWFYPRGGTATLVSEQEAHSQSILLDNNVDVTLSGSIAATATGGVACDICGSGVRVTSTFSSASGTEFTVGSKAGKNTAGDVICSSASDEQGGLSRGYRTLFKDAYASFSPNFDDKGNLVWEEPYTVTFESDNGTIATISGLLLGDSVTLPSAADMKKADSATTSYEFLGWALAPNASQDEVVLAADATSATVSESVSYYPVYKAHARAVTVTFSGARDAAGRAQDPTIVTAEYGSTLSLSSYGASAPVAADYSDGSATYRFVGWRDSAGMVWDGASFDTEVAIDSSIAGATTGAASLSAVYVCVGEAQHLIRFKIDATVKAYAVDAGVRPSYYSATGASSIAPAKVSSVAGITCTFAGWHNGRLAISQPADVDFASGAALPIAQSDATYTACFSESKTKGKVCFVTLQEMADGSYAKRSSESIVAEYGENVFDLASQFARVGDETVANGRIYKMLGWSVRSDDAEPLYTDNIPFAPSDGTVTYYAVYEETEQTASVVFYDGSTEYAKVDGFGVSGTLEAALKQTGASSPADKSASRVFKGWSTSKEAASADVDMTASVLSLSGGASSLNLYAVYGDAYKPTVTFVDSEDNVISRISVDAGTTLSDVEMPSVPAREGMYMSGWALTSTGEVLAKTKALTSDVRLAPKYSAIESIADPSDPERRFNGYADVSKATLTAADAVGAHSVVFMLDNASTCDATLESQASLNGDSPISGATYAAFYAIDQKKLSSAGNIGSVSINVSCGSISPSSKVRVYWKRGDGSVGYTSALTQDSGSVTFTMSSYSSLSSDGNLMVAEVGAGTSAIDGTTNGTIGTIGAITGGATLAQASTAAAGVVSGNLSKAVDASAASSLSEAASSSSLDDAAASLAQAASAEAGVLADAGADDGMDSEDARAAAQRIAGNPIAWATALLGAGGIGAAVWWMLVGRKRNATEEDEAGWSDEIEGDEGANVSIAAGDAASAPQTASQDPSKGSGGISFS